MQGAGHILYPAAWEADGAGTAGGSSQDWPGSGRQSRRFGFDDAGRGADSRNQPEAYVSSRSFTAGGILVSFEALLHLKIPVWTHGV